MNSLEGIRRALADPQLFLKVQTRTILPQYQTARLQMTSYWPVAAGLAILIALNIFITLHSHKAQNPSQEVPAAVATDYLSYLGPIKL